MVTGPENGVHTSSRCGNGLRRTVRPDARSRNKDEQLQLAKVVFGEAERRGGLPEITERYFSEMDPEAKELLEERRRAMSSEDLDRRRASIETMFSKPDVSSLVRAWATA